MTDAEERVLCLIRSGTAEDLVSLISAAHDLGIRVLLDVVHSHSCSNVGESLNAFNGTDGMYFKTGPGGTHSEWGTRVFDYGHPEVIRFLLWVARPLYSAH